MPAGFDDKPPRHHYSQGEIHLLIQFVLVGGSSLRGASRLFELLQQHLNLPLQVPHWLTGRQWLLRVGYWKLVRAKERADDWVWLVDHSAQIGQEKCLVILGVRLSELPPVGECLRHEDLELIELLPVTTSNQEVVHAQFEQAIAKTGVPRAILEDHGSDLHAGATQFCQQHEHTLLLSDIKHKAARLLKHQLNDDTTWNSFSTLVGQTKFSMQQTELSQLVPPSQRSKARFMNLGKLISWGRNTLAILEDPPQEVLKHVTVERLEQKLGWLRQYREELAVWSRMQAVIDTTVSYVTSHGLYRGIAEELKEEVLSPLSHCARSDLVRHELISFVATESSKARPGERLPGSTEVLESCFGKLKYLEGEQSKSGFTGLLLSLGAIVSKTTQEVVTQAMTATRTRDVLQWCKDQIGETLQAKRQQAYGHFKPETDTG